MKNIIAIDLETTGLSSSDDQIIEIGAVKFDSDTFEVLDVFEMLVDPRRKIPSEASDINGITNKMVKGQKSISEALEGFKNWAGDYECLVAHNAKFEAGFLAAADPSLLNKPIFDTLKAARSRLKGRDSYKLTSLVKVEECAHRALPDAKACVTLYKMISDTYKNQKVPAGSYTRTVSAYVSAGDNENRRATTKSRVGFMTRFKRYLWIGLAVWIGLYLIITALASVLA